MLVFTLQPRTWYAMEYIFPSAERHLSPIWVQEITPLKTGVGMLRLHFYHANYSEGVRDKSYDLQIVHRFKGHLVALRRESEDGVHATVLLQPMTREWFVQHFPGIRLRDASDATFATELDRVTERIPS